MKKTLLLILLITAVIISCSKKNDPKPEPTPTLAITDFNPKSAGVGVSVMITGTAFGTDTNAVSVKFGSSTGVKPKSVTSTSMTVNVPADAQTGSLQVTVNNSSVTSADVFTFTKAPVPVVTITSFSPASGKPGTIVIINGTNFGTDTNFVSVQFGGAAGVKPTAISATSLSVVVPSTAQTGKIQVTVNGGTPAVSSGTFTFTPPPFTITGISPKTVSEGDTLVISGTQFGTNASSDLVYLMGGGIYDTGTKPLSVTPTQILVVVPHNAISGKVTVYIQGLGSVTSTDSFTYLPRTSFLQISPTSARVGEVITVNGIWSVADINKIHVRFSGSAKDYNPLSLIHSNDDILVRVPADAVTGYVTITMDGYGPGKSLNIFTVLPPMPPVVSGKWTQRPDFLTTLGKAGAFTFTVNNVAYVGGGVTNAPFDGYGTSDMWAYDPVYNAWEQVADFGGGIRTYAAAFAVGTKGYAGTGIDQNGALTNDFWEYDPAANSWVQKANFKGAVRATAIGCAVGNNGYVGTGKGGTSSNEIRYNDFYSYSPASNSWTQLTNITGSRAEAFAFVLDNKIFVGGNDPTITPNNADLEMYDPNTNAWTTKANIPNYAFIGNNAAFTIGENAYVGLGIGIIAGTPTNTDQVFQYNALANTWTALPAFAGGARNSAVGFSIGNIGYFGMGQPVYSGVFKDFWAYTP